MAICSKDRVAVFVDGPNLTAHQTDFRIDMAGLKNLAFKYGPDIVSASWYDLIPESPEVSNIKHIPKSRYRHILRVIKTKGPEGLESFLASCKNDRNQTMTQDTLYILRRKAKRYWDKKESQRLAEEHFKLVLESSTSFSHSYTCPFCRKIHTLRGRAEKGITDLKLSIDMLVLAAQDKYDNALLIAGDGHYVHAVRAVQSLGKSVFVSFFDNPTNYELAQIADEFLSFSKVIHEIEA